MSLPSSNEIFPVSASNRSSSNLVEARVDLLHESKRIHGKDGDGVSESVVVEAVGAVQVLSWVQGVLGREKELGGGHSGVVCALGDNWERGDEFGKDGGVHRWQSVLSKCVGELVDGVEVAVLSQKVSRLHN